jgi:hypothetical protein
MSLPQHFQTLFPLGIVTITSGIKALHTKGLNPLPYLERHARGDWGDVSLGDNLANTVALLDGDDRLFSAFNTPQGRIWIITVHDRSFTTICLPAEY